jgi:uncharacterized protein
MTTCRRYTANPQASVRLVKRADGDAKTITGYAAVFYRAGAAETEYVLWQGQGFRVVERIMRGLFNHNPSLILGRTSAGTARLAVDSSGLRYEIDAPDTTVGRDLLVSLDRGDVDGSSFAFVPKRTVWVEEEGQDVREIHDLDLFDISPVTFPAYEGTDAGVRLRAAGEAKPERAEWEEWKARRNRHARTAIELRCRELDLQDSGF